MHLLISFLFALSAQASDNYKNTEGRKVFVGPSFKIWCSLTKKGKEKVGKKHKLAAGNEVLFPQTGGTGHIPQIVARDFAKKDQLNQLVADLKTYCAEDLKPLTAHMEKNLKGWLNNKVALISLRAFDEILWEYYEGRYKDDKMKNVCEIRRAYNVKKSWLLTYSELNKNCL